MYDTRGKGYGHAVFKHVIGPSSALALSLMSMLMYDNLPLALLLTSWTTPACVWRESEMRTCENSGTAAASFV